MKISFLVKALIIGICALLLSSYFVSQNRGIKSFDTSVLLTDFDANLVDGIKMQTAVNKELAQAQKVLTQWQLPNKFGYAADVTELSKLLQSLKDAHILELKTKQQKYFDRLGLQAITEASSTATLLTLSSASNSIELLIGNESNSANGRYVRFNGEQQTYLVDLNIDIPSDDTSWLMPNIVSVEFDDIRQVDISLPDGDFSIARKEVARKEIVQDKSDIGVDIDVNVKGTSPLKSQVLLNKTTLAENFELTTVAKEALKGSKIKDSKIKSSKREGKTLQYDSIFTGLVRNILNVKAKDIQLAKSNKMQLFETIVISYLGDVNLSQEKKTSPAKATRQTNKLTLKLYENNSEQTDYWLQVDNQKWLLKISEFDFKQISKSLDSYFE